MKPRNRCDTNGSTFISVIIFGLILFLMSAGFLLMTTSEHKLNRRSYDNAVATNLAEAGADYAIWAMNLPGTDPQYISNWAGADPKTKSVPSFQTPDGQVMGDFEVKAYGLGGANPYIESTSYVPSKDSTAKSTRRIKVKVQPGTTGGPFSMGFFGTDNVNIEGNCLSDSYDSRLGAYGPGNNGTNCDIGTNGSDIKITGSAQIKGDIKTFGSTSGEISITGSDTIDGNISTRGAKGTIKISGSRTINGDISATGTTSSTIDISGSGTINGDVRVSGTSPEAINISGSTEVTGDAATGPGGTVKLSKSATVSGSTTHDQGIETPEPEKSLPPVSVPSSLTSLSYGVNGEGTDGLWTKTGSGPAPPIPAGNWKLKRIKLTGSSSLTIGTAGMETNIYLASYTGDSMIHTGSSQITCLGKVTFYVDGKVQSSGHGIWNEGNTPPNCLIYGTSTCTHVELTGDSAFYGAIYAPEAKVHVKGSNESYGAFIGKSIEAKGDVGFHYDEALGAVGGGTPSGYTVVHWQEKQ